MKSHASQGGCHSPNYRTEVLILIPDIDRTYGIAMRPKATTATKISTPGLASLSTPGAGGGGTPLFVEDHCAAEGIIISMDGRGRCMDNIFIERFWRSLKYEDIYLKSYETIPELTQGLDTYFNYYNHQRPHQALADQTPAEVHHGGR